MKWVFGALMAGGLVLAHGQAANAQDSLNAFGAVPAGITTGSPYGFYPGGYAPTMNYRTGRYIPGTTYYTSGYYGGAPGTVTYGTGIDRSAGAPAYGAGASPYSPRYVPSYGTYYRRGLFGRRYYYGTR